MLGTTSHDLPLPMPWRRCANTIGDKWVFASPIAKSRDKNYPASCANASPMHSAGRLDGQSRAWKPTWKPRVRIDPPHTRSGPAFELRSRGGRIGVDDPGLRADEKNSAGFLQRTNSAICGNLDDGGTAK